MFASQAVISDWPSDATEKPLKIYSVTVVPPGLPSKYAKYVDVFEKKLADILPEHRIYDIRIELSPGSVPKWGPIYNLTEPELKVLYDYIQENLAKGFITHSTSPAGAPVFFVKKKDGTLTPSCGLSRPQQHDNQKSLSLAPNL